MTPEETFRGWHWLSHDRKLRYGDGRVVVDGEPLSSAEPPKPCHSGMHASATILQAFGHADLIAWSPDGHAWLCEVELKGEICHAGDKSVARTRTVVRSKRVHVSTVVEFARWCAARAAADRAAAARAAARAAAAAYAADDAAAAYYAYAAAYYAAARAAERSEQETWWQQKWSAL